MNVNTRVFLCACVYECVCTKIFLVTEMSLGLVWHRKYVSAGGVRERTLHPSLKLPGASPTQPAVSIKTTVMDTFIHQMLRAAGTMTELQEPGDTQGPCPSANVTLGESLRTRSERL